MVLNVELTRVLPGIVGVREEDRLGANGAGNSLDGSLLLGNTGNSGSVGITSVGPASLQVQDVLVTDALEDLVLGQSELSSLGGGGVGVEEGVDVGSDNVDGGAQGGRSVLLPDVDGLGGGDVASVAGALEGGLGGGDERGQLGGGNVAAGDSLVTDDNQLDHAPLGPGVDGVNLLLCTGGAGGLDVDSQDHLHAVLLAGVADVLKTAAVGGVDADQVEALVGDDLDVLGDLVLGHAVTAVGVGGESHTVLAGAGQTGARGAGGLRGGAGAAGNNSGGRDGSSGGGGNSRGRGSSRGLSAGGEGAVVGGVGLSHGESLLGLGVGTGGDGGGNGVHNGGVAGDNGSGTGNHGVGTSSGAGVGGVRNDVGHGGTGGRLGSVGAGNSGLGADNGGDAANGVGTAGSSGSGGTADSGAVSDGEGGGRDGVSASGGVAGHAVGGQSHNDGRGRRGRGDAGGGSHGGSHSHGAGESAGRVDGAGQGAGGLLGAGLRDRDQSRRTPEGDDLGGATTGLLSRDQRLAGGSHSGGGGSGDSALVVQSIVTTVHVTVGQGRAHNGRGSENRALHFEKIKKDLRANEGMPAERVKRWSVNSIKERGKQRGKERKWARKAFCWRASQKLMGEEKGKWRLGGEKKREKTP